MSLIDVTVNDSSSACLLLYDAGCFSMDCKRSKWKQVVCPFSGAKLIDNMSVDEMARSLQVSVVLSDL